MEGVGTEAFGIAPTSASKLQRLFDSQQGLERVWIFGSRARGDYRDTSDIDLAVDAPRLSADDWSRLGRAIEDLGLVYRVDAINLEDRLDQSLRDSIERDRKIFWQPRNIAHRATEPASIELKEFQSTALSTLGDYMDELLKQRAKAEKVAALKASEPDVEVPDFALKTWQAMVSQGKVPASSAARGYSSRFDGTGQPIPNVCLKVPTGGGKTLLASAAISSLHARYCRRHTGLVLWIVPNEAIYTQTRKSLADRDHPYRQLLNVAGAGRVKLLEKDSPLSAMDVNSHLCVMLLMLQSASRQSKETLRFFRDRGNVHGFFPREDDLQAHWKLLEAVPNLSVYAPSGVPEEAAARQMGSIVKDSLGNVMRVARPMVVIDEGHHAYTETALRTIDGLNPSFVLELSATPRVAKRSGDHGANVLVEVHGTDLEREEMIKLPINVDVRPWPDWQACLSASIDRLKELDREAQSLRADTARYIRPILLVQAERTGSDQVESGLIHAEHVKAFLLQLGLQEREIAIKTSEKDDLAQPENQDLTSAVNAVRVIITKQALQEGWDCPFAYVLCALAAGRNPAALTQLVGRILRQPQAAKTGRAPLDECYVYCHDARTADVVAGIKKSLEVEGMGDLASNVRVEGAGQRKEPAKVERRPAFKGLRVFLPRVTWVEGEARRELAYESDILGSIDWGAIAPDMLAVNWRPSGQGAHEQRVRVGLELLGSAQLPAPRDSLMTAAALDRVFISRAISDLVPNAWRAYALVDGVVSRLLAQGVAEERIADSTALLVDQLRSDIEARRDALAEELFTHYVREGRIEFRLRADRLDYEIPEELLADLPEHSDIVSRPDGHRLERSLFDPIYRSMLDNRFEAEFACYLDEQKALSWWHRNVARAGYGLQGWKRNKVSPDFVFAKFERDGQPLIMILETKGLFLKNEDTAYKKRLLESLTAAYQRGDLASAGELELASHGTPHIVCDLVFDQNYRNAVNGKYFVE